MACRCERLSAKFPDMKKAPENDEGEDWLRRCFEYEATHEIAFAYPRALLKAGLIVGMDQARASRSRVPRKRTTGPTRPQE
jgi:hypothetical protein